jgi:anti-sigma regulatory factor (Ser/Thr protein kinase)
LVGVAVARRAGVADAIIDEVRLAIGEACSRAVALHRRHKLTDLVEVELTTDTQFTVRVTDRAPANDASARPTAGHDSDQTDPFGLLLDPADGEDTVEIGAVSDEDVAVGVSLTLLAGLVEDLAVLPGRDGVGSQVCMSWPAGRAS